MKELSSELSVRFAGPVVQAGLDEFREVIRRYWVIEEDEAKARQCANDAVKRADRLASKPVVIFTDRDYELARTTSQV
ncbi:MAG: hypothetical protein H7A52_14950 [Akkermansiaceae bacterium]|nr:hypothetical protein [Akkermansiaceae bacterium]